MNQEIIGKVIKEIRQKNNLSQKDFAKKYGVTYQAVSKWENGKNIPDIQILKQICLDYNYSLESLLEGNTTAKNKKKFNLLVFLTLLVIIIITIASILFFKEEQDFEFKTLSSTSEYFTLTGSIAYNKDKTSIYISDVEYLGSDKKNEYKSIESTLYEIDGKTKTIITTYNKSLLITLEDFLNTMAFKIDNHARVCEEYTEESLLLEISATNIKDQITKYEIPIALSDNCQK